MRAWPQRQAALEAAIREYLAISYRVVSRSNYVAQLVRPKVFSLFWAVFWLCMLLVCFLVYLPSYIAKGDSTVYLEIDEQGNVHATATWPEPPDSFHPELASLGR